MNEPDKQENILDSVNLSSQDNTPSTIKVVQGSSKGRSEQDQKYFQTVRKELEGELLTNEEVGLLKAEDLAYKEALKQQEKQNESTPKETELEKLEEKLVDTLKKTLTKRALEENTKVEDDLFYKLCNEYVQKKKEKVNLETFKMDLSETKEEETPSPVEEIQPPEEEIQPPEEETPTTTEEIPTTTEEIPPPTEEISPPTEEIPPPTEEIPPPTEEQHDPNGERRIRLAKIYKIIAGVVGFGIGANVGSSLVASSIFWLPAVVVGAALIPGTGEKLSNFVLGKLFNKRNQELDRAIRNTEGNETNIQNLQAELNRRTELHAKLKQGSISLFKGGAWGLIIGGLAGPGIRGLEKTNLF